MANTNYAPTTAQILRLVSELTTAARESTALSFDDRASAGALSLAEERVEEIEEKIAETLGRFTSLLITRAGGQGRARGAKEAFEAVRRVREDAAASITRELQFMTDAAEQVSANAEMERDDILVGQQPSVANLIA